MQQLPLVRITVEGMQHGILRHLESYHGEIERFVQAELDAFDIEQELRAIIRSELPTLLRAAFREAVKAALYDDEPREHMHRLVLAALTEALQRDDRP